MTAAEKPSPRAKSKKRRPRGEALPSPIANPHNRPKCRNCGCPDMCLDRNRCDCTQCLGCYWEGEFR